MAQTIHIYDPESGVASHAALRSSNVIILNVLFINFHLILGQGGGVPIIIILLKALCHDISGDCYYF